MIMSIGCYHASQNSNSQYHQKGGIHQFIYSDNLVILFLKLSEEMMALHAKSCPYSVDGRTIKQAFCHLFSLCAVIIHCCLDALTSVIRSLLVAECNNRDFPWILLYGRLGLQFKLCEGQGLNQVVILENLIILLDLFCQISLEY